MELHNFEKDIKSLIENKKQPKSKNEYIQTLFDIQSLCDLSKFFVNDNSRHVLSWKELYKIKNIDKSLYKKYILETLTFKDTIAKKFVNNLAFFNELDFFGKSNTDYLEEYKLNDILDIIIDFFYKLNLEYGNLIYDSIRKENLIFYESKFPEIKGMMISTYSNQLGYAFVSKVRNNSKKIVAIAHELSHLLNFYINPQIGHYLNNYNNFSEVVSYTIELLLFEYLKSNNLIPNYNDLEKSYLKNFYLVLLIFDLFLKQGKIDKNMAKIKIPEKYLIYFFDKSICIPINRFYQDAYAKSIAYLFLEQYHHDFALMLYNFKDFIKNYTNRSDYDNLNSDGLSLDKIENNEPLQKALQKYSNCK